MTYLPMIYETKNILWSQLYTSWITEELFSFPWWFTVISMVAAYIIWWKLLDKSRLIELLLFGSLMAVMGAVTDTIADNLTLWQYKVKILPFTPGFFPYHLTLAPIIFILVYQYAGNWPRYLIGSLAVTAVYSFAVVPLFIAVGEVQLFKWNHGYTFISVIARALTARWVLEGCKKVQNSYQKAWEHSHRFMQTCPATKPLPDMEEDREGGS